MTEAATEVENVDSIGSNSKIFVGSGVKKRVFDNVETVITVFFSTKKVLNDRID